MKTDSKFMLITALLGLTLINVSLAKLETLKDCGKSLAPQARIVNGTTVKFGKYPWMVSVQEKNSKGQFNHVCGAAVINEHWIVTAAHCFDTPVNKNDYKVYVGLRSILLPDEATVQKHEISDIIIHDDYDEDSFVNDIALIKTKKAIDIKGSKGYVNGICLPKGVTTPSGQGIVIGWGKIKSDGPMINLLQEATLPIVDWQTCKRIYESDDSEFEKVVVTAHMFCAGGQGKDSCQNDSGGPFFQVDSKGVATLIGVVANGADCAYKHYPGMYMKVSAFTTWMGKKMT